MRKTQPLLVAEHDVRLADGSESYSSNSSFSDSYSDSSDLANWEEHIAEDGTLFYAEYMQQLRKTSAHNSQERRIEFTRSSTLRMGKKLARRQQQQQPPQQQQKQVNGSNKSNATIPATTTIATTPTPQESFKFSNINTSTTADNMKQLELFITAADRYRFGRRSTAVESILGFRVVPFVDQSECLMFDGFVHDMPAIQQQTVQQPIKRGDWFKSLDDIEIRTSNVDELLLQFLEPTKVCLKFQGAHAELPVAEPGHVQELQQLKKVENFAMFAELFDKLHTESKDEAKVKTTEHVQQLRMPFGMLILPPECYQHDQHKDSLYYYPEQATENFLYKARGSFLTLNVVLSEELQTRPLVSKLLVEDVQYYVSYRALNGFLVLFAYAAQYVTLPEANLRADELIAYMRFAFPSLNLHNFDNVNAASRNLRKFLHDFCEIQRVRLLSSHKRQSCLFEELLKESRSLPLPKEAQLRVFDALSEMEAMDYRNWNDEPLNTHREFFIYGSVLYYDHYVLAAQMPLEVRANVESFLRCRGIFDFIGTHYVKELYVWEEIVLPNATGRYFLTICSRSHLLLAVILKIFDAPDLAPNATIPPSLFYIEEIQETLDHLIQCGIESLAMFWSVSNKRPEVLDKFEVLDDSSGAKETNKLDLLLKPKFTSNSASSSSSVLQTQRSISYDEDAHICSSLGGSSIHSLTPSEDDASRKRITAAVANNNNNNNNNSSNSNNNNNNSTSGIGDDSDSGSDWDNFAEQHPLHYGLDTQNSTHMTESLWKEINNVVPVKISAGWKNAIFYYVYVDNANGSVFCPLKPTSDAFPFISEMRKTCHVIHEVLQNTKNFRRLLALETTTKTIGGTLGNNNGSNTSGAGVGTAAGNSNGNSSKGILAIKEHGITIQVRQASNEDAHHYSNDVVGVVKGRFVVVGRLFHTPTKEVYVCHRPDVPQNMVEMAFRLSFFSVG